MLNKFSKAKTIGILISSKPGQENLKSAEVVKEQLEKKGKKVYMFYFDTLIPEELLNFPQIEAWVNTACPRISIDDIERFDKPVVDAKDILKQMA
jgi:2-(3-amino-3-carboxypropyl)histidine synthase